MTGPVLQSLLEAPETSEIVAPLIEGIKQDKLKKVGQTFKLFQRGEIGPCGSTPSPVSIPNLVPSMFCRIPAAAPVPVEEAPTGVE